MLVGKIRTGALGYYNIIDGVHNIRAVLPFLPVSARQPTQQETARYRHPLRLFAANQVHPVAQLVQLAGGTGGGLRVGVGGPLLHREEQAGHFQVPALQFHGRHTHAQGNTDGTAQVLIMIYII